MREREREPSKTATAIPSKSALTLTYQSAHKFRGPKLQSWLYGIAMNVMRNYVRKEVARKRITLTLAEQPLPEASTPNERDVARVRAALAQLPRKLRQVLILVDLQGERGADVAVALGIPEGTLWRRLSDARARLRDAMELDS